MSEQFESLNNAHISFINEQHLFFVATAAAEGTVNLSPKGMDSLRILDKQNVAWLNLTGSGNESAAHVVENNRMTLMFCSFGRQPLILRLYGTANVLHPRDQGFTERLELFPAFTGTRQIFAVHLDLIQTSCGYAVPLYQHKGDRETLTKWSDQKGPEGIQEYWADRNQLSLDGLPTYILGNHLNEP